MGQFTDIKALAGKVLKFGKVGSTIDAQAPTANRQVYLPDADVDLRAGTDGQALTRISATSIGWNDVNAKRLLTRVFNNLGSTVAKAKVVYLNGVQGDRPRIALAQANSEATSSKTFGLTFASILNMEDGQVITEGLIDGLNTDVVGFNEGDSLWLSPTSAGDYTNVMPVAPNNSVFIGTLVRKHHTQGSIQVKIQNGYELEELHNVSIPTTPTDGQVLTWETATSLWKAKTVSGGGGGGYTEIAANGTISGTYSGIVFCLGNVSVAGNVTVKGSLYIIGNITNTGGYSITVNGDCIIDGYIDFLAASSTTQQNITVDGDLIVRGERISVFNQVAVGAGSNEGSVTDIGQRGNALGGVLVNVTEITPGTEFDLTDASGFFPDLSLAAGVGNYLGDQFSSVDSEILTMVDQGGGVWRVTVDTPIALGTTARLGTRNIYETSDSLLGNSLFWSFSFGQFGDIVEFPTLASTGLFASHTLGFGTAWIKLQSNVTGIINEFSSHYFAKNQVITVSGNPGWSSFNDLYVVSGTGPLGEDQTIFASNAFDFFNLTVRLSAPYSTDISFGTILAEAADLYITMASGDLDGETITFGPGSTNAGATVTLSFPFPYSGPFWSGYTYSVTPTTTVGMAVGDSIDISSNEGSRISPNGSTANGVIFVGGDFISKGIDLTPQASDIGGPMSLTVNGDIIGLKISTKEAGETKVILSGLTGVNTFSPNAGNITVGGDVIGMTIEANGGASTTVAYPGGNGGHIVIGGDFDGFTYYDDGSFGNTNTYGSSPIFSANYYQGNYISNNGGNNSGTVSNAGAGGRTGKLKIFGDCRLKSLSVRGGDYTGNIAEGDGGDVDEIYIGGNFFCSSTGNIRPGFTRGVNNSRPLAGVYVKSPYFGGDFAISDFTIGNSPGSQAVSAPAYANILIEGDLLSVYAPSNLYLYTKDVNQDYIPTTQAKANTLRVRGSSNITSIRAGWSNVAPNESITNFNGGQIIISGNNRSIIWASGSQGPTGQGSGDGGSVTINGDNNADIFVNGYGSKAGGTIDIRGSHYSGVLGADGGAGISATGLSTTGGLAGTITIGGDLVGGNSSQLFARGGASANNAGNGNQGGTVTIRGSVVGSTSSQMSLWGGNASGTTGNGNGGSGGSLIVRGNVTGWVFATNGGTARAGGTGGTGSSVTIGGFYSNSSTNTAITTSGGNANTPGTNGAAGSINLSGGSAIHSIQAVDGQGTGAAPGFGYGLRLGGNNTLFSISMTNRVGVIVAPINNSSGNMTNTMLLVTQMVGKNRLDNPGGGTTGIHTPGNLYFATNNQWFRVAGTVA
jgi:hypothetical protein